MSKRMSNIIIKNQSDVGKHTLKRPSAVSLSLEQPAQKWSVMEEINLQTPLGTEAPNLDCQKSSAPNIALPVGPSIGSSRIRQRAG